MSVNEKSYIYFIQGETTHFIKIGKTYGSVENRIKQLQTGSPDILKVIGLTFEPESSEDSLHEKFKCYRAHGEWFYPEEEIFSFIRGNCFKSIQSVYHAYPLVLSGQLSYSKAVKMSVNELKKLSRNLNFKKFDSNGIYKI